MCRMLTYVGPPVAASALLVDQPHSIVDQCTDARLQTSGCDNPDGWGIGWYDAGGGVHRHRTTTPMPSDAAGLRDLASITSGHFVAHVRLKSPGSPTEEAGNAPFIRDRWLFAHNGYVAGFREGRREELRARLSPARLAALEGDADSEVIFGLVLDQLDAGAAPLDALVEVLTSLDEGKYNVVLTDGETMVVSRWRNSLWWRRDDPVAGAVVIVSEPYDERPGWVEVDDGTFLVCGRDGVSSVAVPADPSPAGARS
jgi:glutamine amidotransferase